MQVASARFGTIEIEPTDLIRFPAGLVGLSSFASFILLQSQNNPQIYWLQSVDEPMFSIALVSAELFDKYIFEPSPEDFAALGVTDVNELATLLVINKVDGQFTVNLRGPILFNPNTRMARQIVLDQDLPLREPFPLELTALQ